MKILKEYGLHELEKDKEIGIEVEMEGRRFSQNYPPKWTIHLDGSLRGDSIEYVLKSPVKRKEVVNVLKILDEFLREHDTKIDASDRCGVHVHVNCQQLSNKKVMNFIGLYIILEDLLVKWCGEQREGNMFCLRSRDADWIIENLVESHRKGHFQFMQNDQFKYASINISALCKFGSLEFRSMPTPKNLMSIDTWVDFLLRIKDKALKFHNVKEMIESLSGMGQRDFLDMIMGHKAELLQCPHMNHLIMDGVRRIQPVAYSPWPRKQHTKLFRGDRQFEEAMMAAPMVDGYIMPDRFVVGANEVEQREGIQYVRMRPQAAVDEDQE